jgi:hypothetical protein
MTETKQQPSKYERKVRQQLIRILPRSVLEDIVAADNPKMLDLGTLRMRAMLDWDEDSLDEVVKYVQTAGK